jgi:hypothetical protein
MKKSKLKLILKEMNIDPCTISFYCDADGSDKTDAEFGLCDITGEECVIVGCRALSLLGREEIYFEASENLVSGSLGELAGAF